MRNAVFIFFVSVAACSTEAAVPPASNAIRRAVEGYAVASCLTEQKEPYLREQGDGWASNIVQREAFDLELFKTVSAAVDAELAKGEMAQIIVENPPMTLKLLPVQYCGEIIHTVQVRRVVENVIKRLGTNPRLRR